MKRAFAALSAAALLTPAPVQKTPVKTAEQTVRSCGQDAARVRASAAGTVREPNEMTAAQIEAVEQRIATLTGLTGEPPAFAARTAAPVVIPVYVHDIHDGPDGKAPIQLIQRQIATMNKAYATTGFTFALKGTDWTDNAGWYSDPQGSEKAFKTKLHRGGLNTLNLYIADLGDSLLGWSTFPWQGRQAPALDGVVVHVGTLPGGSIPDYDLGYSAVHETGHWLGLYHPFEGWDPVKGTTGCAGPGDRVADTPPEGSPTTGCPLEKDTCPFSGPDPIHNYMDYSYDPCMNQFSKGQSQRMHKLWAAYR